MTEEKKSDVLEESFEIVIVGGGAAGIAVAASLLKRRPSLRIAIIEPRETHSYQPGWTLVGAGVFEFAFTQRPTVSLIPRRALWIKASVTRFLPDENAVMLSDGRRLRYETLVAAPGLELAWDAVDGLEQTLGKNGVTSNYKEGLSRYTWELVQKLDRGAAIFTQPSMPIKCAGAPQKALYLSCDHWRRAGKLTGIDVHFCNAGAALFGVADYVPAMMKYIERYNAKLNFGENLVAVDGERRVAVFESKKADGAIERVERRFDFLHVTPPQRAPAFVASSPLAGPGGWIDVKPDTLQHAKYPNVFALGDACSAPNAKTAAAVRKQAPVVAENLLSRIDGSPLAAAYDGYGSCPLTVERGRIVLAEFGYGGKLLPTFPAWLVDGKTPTRLAWFLKEKMLPDIYWRLMLKGREWLAAPKRLPAAE